MIAADAFRRPAAELQLLKHDLRRTLVIGRRKSAFNRMSSMSPPIDISAPALAESSCTPSAQATIEARQTNVRDQLGAINHFFPFWPQFCVTRWFDWTPWRRTGPKRLHDKNFGHVFSFWDKIFGTLSLPKSEERMEFGIEEPEARDYRSLFGLFVTPVLKIWRRLRPGEGVALTVGD